MNDLLEPGELGELKDVRAEVTGRRPAELPKARAMLLVEIRGARQDSTWSSHHARRHHARSLRPALLVGGVAAGLAAVLAVSLLPGGTARQPHPGQGTTALTAAYVLNRAAAAAATPQPVPRPDQFIYDSSVYTDIGYIDPGSAHEKAWLTRSGGEHWTSVDGRQAGMVHFTQQANEKLPWGPVPPPATGPLGWLTLPGLSCPRGLPVRGTYTFFTTLPTDPASLRTWIYQHLDGQNPPDTQAWIDIGDMLRYSRLVPPEQGTALFRVLATIPGATVVPGAVNAVGRSGVAVSLSGAELIFDPRTYQLIGERTVLTKPEAGVGPAGTVTESSAEIQVRIVSSLPDVPPSQVDKSGGDTSC
jgi:hypothetical protein